MPHTHRRAGAVHPLRLRLLLRGLLGLALLASSCAPAPSGDAAPTGGTDRTIPVSASSPSTTILDTISAPSSSPTTPGAIESPKPPVTTPGTIESPVVLIPGCAPYAGSLSSLECLTLASYADCTDQLISGDLADCRSKLPVPFLQEEATSGFALTATDTLTIEVFSAEAGSGRATGEGFYRMALGTPVRPPAEHCDLACPTEVCGEDHCNRSCIKADHRSERTTGATGGIFAISLISDQPTCEAEISGTVEADFVDLHRAYEACDRSDSWGGTTSIDLTVKAGKLYQFNNPTAVFTTEGNTATWEYTNDAEIYLLYRHIAFPADVTCRVSRTTP